jgi:hypothetical protein
VHGAHSFAAGRTTGRQILFCPQICHECWRVRPVIETVLRDLNLTPLFSKCGIVLHLQDSVALRKRSVALRTSSLMKPEHGRRGRASAEANFFELEFADR